MGDADLDHLVKVCLPGVSFVKFYFSRPFSVSGSYLWVFSYQQYFHRTITHMCNYERVTFVLA